MHDNLFKNNGDFNEFSSHLGWHIKKRKVEIWEFLICYSSLQKVAIVEKIAILEKQSVNFVESIITTS